MHYPVLIELNASKNFSTVDVPDLSKHYQFDGTNLDEIWAQLTYQVEQTIGEYLSMKERIPEPSPIHHLRKTKASGDGIWALINISEDFFMDEVERVNITISRKILALLDSHAKNSFKTRSAMIAHMALVYEDPNNR